MKLNYREMEELRLASYLPPLDFADSLGVGYATYKRWCDGTSMPSNTVSLLATILYSGDRPRLLPHLLEKPGRLTYEQLEAMRIKANLSIAQFVCSLGLEQTAYYRWRYRTARPSLPVSLLARLLYEVSA